MAARVTGKKGAGRSPDSGDGVPSFASGRRAADATDGVELFRIDGRAHRMPRVLPQMAGRRVLDAIGRGRNADLAILAEVLPPASYEALLACDEVSRDDWGRLVRAASDHLFGHLEAEDPT